jgi:hypothetical protein
MSPIYEAINPPQQQNAVEQIVKLARDTKKRIKENTNKFKELKN